MGDMNKYAGPEDTYGATDAENQNNALRMGADNSINDPNWQKRKLKKGIQMSKPAKASKKINIAKSYSE
jgi:hypothetical protein